jgi:hypothetical protein
MENLKIQKSVYPDNPINEEQWLNEFKVSSRAISIHNTQDRNINSRELDLMENYDFKKLNTKKYV